MWLAFAQPLCLHLLLPPSPSPAPQGCREAHSTGRAWSGLTEWLGNGVPDALKGREWMPLSQLEPRGLGGGMGRQEQIMMVDTLSCLPGSLQVESVMRGCYAQGTRGAQRETLIQIRGPRTHGREIGPVIGGSAQVGGEGRNLSGRGSDCKRPEMKAMGVGF